MSDSNLNVALRISAVDAFGGVLSRLRRRIGGLGSEAGRVQGEYDRMFRHIAKGVAGLAAAKYNFDHLLKPGIKNAADLQSAFNDIRQVLHGAHLNAALLNREMIRVKQNSIEVASHMMYSAIAVAGVTSNLLQGGVPLAAIVEGRTKSGRRRHGAAYESEVLAEVSGFDPATIAMRVGKIGHAFAVDPQKYGKMIDEISRVKMSSSGTLDELMYNLEKSGAAFRQMGIPFRQAAITMGALSPLGEQSSSEVRAMFRGFQATTKQRREVLSRLHLNFYDKAGNFVGMPTAIKEMRSTFIPMRAQERQQYMYELFRRGGTLAADMLIAPEKKGAKTWADIATKSDAATTLAERNRIKNRTLNMKSAELSSTNVTTAGILFEPLLRPLTRFVGELNAASGSVSKYAVKHNAVSAAVSYGGAAITSAAGVYGIYHLIKAIRPGTRVLRGLFGRMGSSAAGIVEGKAIQAATGVQPVFVTNQPPSMQTGTAAAAALATTRLRTVSGLKGLLGATFSLRGGFMAATKQLGLLGIAAGAGALVGHEIYKHAIKGSALEHAMYSFADREGAWFHMGRGWMLEQAKRKGERLNRGHYARMEAARVDVHLHVAQDGTVRVHKLTTSHPNVQAHVGTALSTP